MIHITGDLILDGRPLLQGLALDCPQGRWTALMGPGKLRTALASPAPAAISSSRPNSSGKISRRPGFLSNRANTCCMGSG